MKKLEMTKVRTRNLIPATPLPLIQFIHCAEYSLSKFTRDVGRYLPMAEEGAVSPSLKVRNLRPARPPVPANQPAKGSASTTNNALGPTGQVSRGPQPSRGPTLTPTQTTITTMTTVPPPHTTSTATGSSTKTKGTQTRPQT